MKSAGAAARIFAIMDREPAMTPVALDAHGAVAQSSARAQEPVPISFRDVTFAYPNRPDALVVDNMSFKVEAGEVVALVGGSGSGKSTCASLLTRLYDIQNGSIFVDGVDIRDIDPQRLRASIGVVAQEPTLFANTIFENIRYGRLDATREEVIEAARAARVLDFSDDFDGLDTYVGQRGAQLSGAKAARCRRPSNHKGRQNHYIRRNDVCSRRSVRISRAVWNKTIMKGRTVISIAHRLSTIRSADRIAVLEDGKIAETGSFDDLAYRAEVHFMILCSASSDDYTLHYFILVNKLLSLRYITVQITSFASSLWGSSLFWVHHF